MCTKEEALNLLETTDKPIKFTYGLAYRNPTTYKVPMTREDAIKTLSSNGLVDMQEFEDYVHVNKYSENDMW